MGTAVVKITEDRERFLLTTSNPLAIEAWESHKGDQLRVVIPAVPAVEPQRCGCKLLYRVFQADVERIRPDLKETVNQFVCKHQVDIGLNP